MGISIDDDGIVPHGWGPCKAAFVLARRGADFVRQHQKVGGFLVPAEDETLADVRSHGKMP